ncbi:hypothetical protein ER13_07665 [Brevundimonas sp. EAKA]|uniref:DUF2163 domain-containing protein n=1 Tax=Brevundimonas sp. EAKA TaxID=1495854 RepID=UPI0004A94178|nr:DUF2163 domain-containing protein [Brevundimonas sp. EAKA]KDP92763.1 hypothetical protein ER13_07665 [Brevundimonas sp. EAKA]
MRDIPDEMAARIESGAARLCHVWRLERADGAVTGFTDHDRDLAVDGLVCRAGSGWTAGAAESAVGLAAGSVSAAGALDDAAITEADVAAGRFDGAKVELWRVDWSEPEFKVRLGAGAPARGRGGGGRVPGPLGGPPAEPGRGGGGGPWPGLAFFHHSHAPRLPRQPAFRSSL